MPSEIARIADEYEAFCFDEACLYIIEQIEDKKEPQFREDKVSQEGKRKTFLGEALKKDRGMK